MMKCRDFGGSLIMFDYPYQAQQFTQISKLFTNHMDKFMGGDTEMIWFYIGATRHLSTNNKDFYYDKVFPGSFFPRIFFPDAF